MSMITVVPRFRIRRHRRLLDRSYLKLPAYRSAMRFAQAVYELTKHFPEDERSGLAMTLKRAAVTIPTKVAESRFQLERQESAGALLAAKETLRECAAYLDVAACLRMTARWRFRTPRRRARNTARCLELMLTESQIEVDGDEPHTGTSVDVSLAA